MKKTVWTFGLISGAILSVMMLLTMPFADMIGYDRGQVIGYTTMVLAFLLIFFGVRSYRDNVAGGAIRFGRALAIGSLITLVASLCYVATWEIIYFKLAPDFAQKFQTMAEEKARASGDSPEEIQKKLDDAQKFAQLYKNPAFNAAITFIEPLPVGLVFALVSAGVLSRKRRSAPASLAATIG
ncbi:MAG: DUF4199 domain-containing protein [Longimicrobiales bacterium]